MIQDRKNDHLKICLEKKVEIPGNGLDKYHFQPQALPEIDFVDIKTQTLFLNQKIEAPLMIAA
ncbi:MAG TPA: type 2 isopentenyl-diphosphate Delta-isomerase, partial [Candidatus Wirthbacteria bacterium]|nr:type 2 isopentenyl-diphosphate Delta-isomerase [Candidatus Wirthbacteria bacterium]